MARRKKRTTVVRFSKRILIWACLAVTMVFIVDAVLCWRAEEQIDSASITAVCGFWGAEIAANAWIKVTEERYKPKNKTNTDE